MMLMNQLKMLIKFVKFIVAKMVYYMSNLEKFNNYNFQDNEDR